MKIIYSLKNKMWFDYSFGSVDGNEKIIRVIDIKNISIFGNKFEDTTLGEAKYIVNRIRDAMAESNNVNGISFDNIERIIPIINKLKPGLYSINDLKEKGILSMIPGEDDIDKVGKLINMMREAIREFMNINIINKIMFEGGASIFSRSNNNEMFNEIMEILKYWKTMDIDEYKRIKKDGIFTKGNIDRIIEAWKKKDNSLYVFHKIMNTILNNPISIIIDKIKTEIGTVNNIINGNTISKEFEMDDDLSEIIDKADDILKNTIPEITEKIETYFNVNIHTSYIRRIMIDIKDIMENPTNNIKINMKAYLNKKIRYTRSRIIEKLRKKLGNKLDEIIKLSGKNHIDNLLTKHLNDKIYDYIPGDVSFNILPAVRMLVKPVRFDNIWTNLLTEIETTIYNAVVLLYSRNKKDRYVKYTKTRGIKYIYHGTTIDVDEILSKLKDGKTITLLPGINNLYGWGVYTTTIYNDAKEYALGKTMGDIENIDKGKVVVFRFRRKDIERFISPSVIRTTKEITEEGNEKIGAHLVYPHGIEIRPKKIVNESRYEDTDIKVLLIDVEVVATQSIKNTMIESEKIYKESNNEKWEKEIESRIKYEDIKIDDNVAIEQINITEDYLYGFDPEDKPSMIYRIIGKVLGYIFKKYAKHTKSMKMEWLSHFLLGSATNKELTDDYIINDKNASVMRLSRFTKISKSDTAILISNGNNYNYENKLGLLRFDPNGELFWSLGTVTIHKEDKDIILKDVYKFARQPGQAFIPDRISNQIPYTLKIWAYNSFAINKKNIYGKLLNTTIKILLPLCRGLVPKIARWFKYIDTDDGDVAALTIGNGLWNELGGKPFVTNIRIRNEKLKDRIIEALKDGTDIFIDNLK